MFKYLLYKFGQFIIHRLPLRVSYKIANFFSDIQYAVSFRDRRAVKNNLKVILQSEEDLSDQAREVFRNFGKYLVDFFRMVKYIDEDYLNRLIKIEHQDRLDRILEHGKGCIMLSAHIGNWELGATALARLGYPLIAVALPHKERPVNDLFNQQREHLGLTVVPSNVAVRKCVEALKSNKLVGLIADRDFSMTGETMNFFGRKAIIPRGAAIFSCRTGAPILPTFLLREKDDTFTLSFGEPLFPKSVTDDEVEKELQLEIMNTYIKIFEQKIRENPTQWLMFREFWIE